MTSPREQEEYFAARNRALKRLVEGSDFTEQSASYFRSAIQYADGGLPVRSDGEIVSLLWSEQNSSFAIICGMLARLEAIKGKSYLSSWQKRGMESALDNMRRKFDRIEAILVHGERRSDSLTETLGDLAVYCIKTIGLQAGLHPEEVKKWVEGVRSLS